ncbi:hypothetical protein ACFQX4_24020 [Roseomonas sp. GCM10028921]
MGIRHPIPGIGRRLLLAAGAAAGSGVLIRAWAQAPTGQPDRSAVTELIKDWPQVAKAAAEEMLRQYGAPQEMTGTRLLWEGNRPWLRSVVNKIGVEHDFPAKHSDVLEQVVSYRVPLNFFEPLASFNGSLVPDRTRGELTAHCDREATNILALNLAHDIIRGHKTVAQAREAMAEGQREIQADRVPADARELRLGPPQGDLRDPDTAAVAPAPGQGTGVSPAIVR